MIISILVPTYNEKENISILIKKIKEYSTNNLNVKINLHVIDDNSPDGTQNVVEDLIDNIESSNFKLSIFKRNKKEGLGKAYIDGFERVLSANINVDFIMQMDADLSHDPKYINEFIIHAKNGAEVIVGSRYLKGGAVPDWSWHRKILSRFGNLYSRFLLGNLITDYTGGFNMYSVAVLRKLDFSKLDNAGYGFLITLKFNMLKLTKKVSQVPIIFYDRTSGKSKMPLNTLLQNFKLVIKLKFEK
jgi:dolichol-phosphate mannosyltransferase